MKRLRANAVDGNGAGCLISMKSKSTPADQFIQGLTTKDLPGGSWLQPECSVPEGRLSRTVRVDPLNRCA